MATPRLDFNITEIERLSGVSRSSADRVMKKFLDWGIVKIADVRGNMNLYSLNQEARMVETIYDFNDALLEFVSPEYSELTGREEESTVAPIEIMAIKQPRYELAEDEFSNPSTRQPAVTSDRVDWCVLR